jgi:hypothetical protein
VREAAAVSAIAKSSKLWAFLPTTVFTLNWANDKQVAGQLVKRSRISALIGVVSPIVKERDRTINPTRS